MDFGLYYYSTKLLDSGKVGDDSQTLTANFFIIDLHNEINQRMYELNLNHFMLRVDH